MPILHVEIVLRPGETIRPGLSQELADRAGEIFGSSLGGTWVMVAPFAAGQYAENGIPLLEVAPVFVTVLKAKWPPPDFMQEEVARLAAAIAQVCQRPAENIHILYLPEATGRVAFGGELLQD